MYKALTSGSSPFTVTLPTEGLGHRNQWSMIGSQSKAFVIFAYQHLLKLETVETCISSEKQMKMHIPYGDLALEEIKLIELN